MIVHVMLRQHEVYPREATIAGVLASGDKLMSNTVSDALDENCAVVTWNKYGFSDRFATQCKAVGGKHIVMENGYLRRNEKYYLMNLDGFNGNETVNWNFSPDRWDKLNIELKPWKTTGKYILVCAQRGKYNYSPMAMPATWPDTVLEKIRQQTDRKIIYKPHPERVLMPVNLPVNCEVVHHKEPLDDLLENAFATVVWTSNAATESLLAGVPVFYCGPTIACKDLAKHGVGDIEYPYYATNRDKIFHNLAWRQWHVSEIQSGEAWRYVTQ